MKNFQDHSASRRGFLKKTALAGAAFVAIPGGVRGRQILVNPQTVVAPKQYSPNDTIRLAVIGMGIMGHNNINAALQVPGTEFVAACDLYQGRLDRAKELFGDDLFTTNDYRKILDRKDVDAVIVATSDHWHDHISIAAMKAGKAVYCEKPMVHKLDEGHAVIKAQKETGMVFQVGSQGVSSIINDKAKELFEEGAIGDLILVDIYNDRFSAMGAWQYSIPTDASTKTVDWEAFVGDAPKRTFDSNHFFRWRNYQEYGTGVAGDLFVHLFSRLHRITSSLGPERIYATGGLRHWKDGRNVPDIMAALYDYPATGAHPAFNVQMRVNFTDGSGGGSHARMVGTEGVMELGYNSITVKRNKLSDAPGYGGWDSYGTFTKAQQAAYEKWYKAKFPSKSPEVKAPNEFEYSLPKGYSDHVHHYENFFAGMREGSMIVEDASFGLRAAGPPLASNMSYFEQKTVKWDPVKMKVLDS
ncbi:MAG: Gfo/Idh/MocA family oxidoreductase [Bacteroidota bacterium]